jgi:hypothetical protein
MNTKSSLTFGFDRHGVHGGDGLVRGCGPLQLEKGGTTLTDCGDNWILWCGPPNGLIGAGDCVRSELFPCCGIDRTDSEGVDDQ